MFLESIPVIGRAISNLRFGHLLLVTVLGFFFSSVGRPALLGDYVDGKEKLPPYECSLITFSQGEQSSCSVTLLTATIAICANHCLQNSELEKLVLSTSTGGVTHSVQCGEKYMPVAKAANMDTPWFVPGRNSLRAGKNSQLGPDDLVLLKLVQPVNVGRFPRLPHNSSEVKELLAEPSNCRVYGLGLDNDAKAGILHGRVLEIYSHLLESRSLHIWPKTVTLGDSGGGVICKKNDEEILIAVHSRFGKLAFGKDRTTESALLVGSSLDWVKRILAPNRPLQNMTGLLPRRTVEETH